MSAPLLVCEAGLSGDDVSAVDTVRRLEQRIEALERRLATEVVT